MNKKQIATIALTLWLTIVVVFMLLLQRFDLEIFFVLTLLGILVIAELIRQRYIQPKYLRYLGYLIGAGLVVFGTIIIQKVMEILA
jgi:type IV secretory pathway TrbL component